MSEIISSRGVLPCTDKSPESCRRCDEAESCPDLEDNEKFEATGLQTKKEVSLPILEKQDPTRNALIALNQRYRNQTSSQ